MKKQKTIPDSTNSPPPPVGRPPVATTSPLTTPSSSSSNRRQLDSPNRSIQRNSQTSPASTSKPSLDRLNRPHSQMSSPSVKKPQDSGPSAATNATTTTPIASTSRPLADVVFSLSGYQNPLRGELRKKACDMGARFRQDWTSDCTHLICAFANTPKFKDVKGRGIIVSDKWIIQCHTTKSKVNWRPYRVGRAPSPPTATSNPASGVSSSVAPNIVGDVDEAEEDDEDEPKTRKSLKRVNIKNSSDADWQPLADEEAESESDNETDEGVPEDESDAVNDDEDGEEEEANDDDSVDQKARKLQRKATKRAPKSSSPSVSQKKPKLTTTPPKPTEWTPVRRKTPNVDPADEDTDDEIQRVLDPPNGQSASLEPIDLPDVFEGKEFFVHNKAIPSDEERLIQRLIVAFAGKLHTYMHPDVQYVITRSTWNDEFDEALTGNNSLIFVRPDWLFACDQQAKWVPYQKYMVVG